MFIETRIVGALPTVPSVTLSGGNDYGPRFFVIPSSWAKLTVRLGTNPLPPTGGKFRRFDSRVGVPLQFNGISYAIQDSDDGAAIQSPVLQIVRPLQSIAIPPPIILEPWNPPVSPNNNSPVPPLRLASYRLALWLPDGVSVSILDMNRRWRWLWQGA